MRLRYAVPAPDPARGQAEPSQRNRIVARRPNYDFQKRQKELKRQEKQAEKAERKRLRKEEGGDDVESIAQPDGDDGEHSGDDDGMPDEDDA